MKTGISILLFILIMTGIVHLSVASHFCGGMLAATRVSLSGELASCGMESERIPLPEGISFFSPQCCDDVVFTLAIDNTYLTSSDLILNHQNDHQNLKAATIFPVSKIYPFNSLQTNVLPPGLRASTHKDFRDICVFRI